MQITPTDIADVVVFEPRVHHDGRGWFIESFNERNIGHALGFTPHFVQDNISHSIKGALRGLHYQIVAAQGGIGGMHAHVERCGGCAVLSGLRRIGGARCSATRCERKGGCGEHEDESGAARNNVRA